MDRRASITHPLTHSQSPRTTSTTPSPAGSRARDSRSDRVRASPSPQHVPVGHSGFTPCQDAPDQLCMGMGDMGEIPASPGQAHGTQLQLSDTGALAPTVWHSKGAKGGLQVLLRGLQRAHLAWAGQGGKGGTCSQAEDTPSLETPDSHPCLHHSPQVGDDSCCSERGWGSPCHLQPRSWDPLCVRVSHGRGDAGHSPLAHAHTNQAGRLNAPCTMCKEGEA